MIAMQPQLANDRGSNMRESDMRKRNVTEQRRGRRSDVEEGDIGVKTGVEVVIGGVEGHAAATRVMSDHPVQILILILMLADDVAVESVAEGVEVTIRMTSAYGQRKYADLVRVVAQVAVSVQAPHPRSCPHQLAWIDVIADSVLGLDLAHPHTLRSVHDRDLNQIRIRIQGTVATVALRDSESSSMGRTIKEEENQDKKYSSHDNLLNFNLNPYISHNKCLRFASSLYSSQISFCLLDLPCSC